MRYDLDSTELTSWSLCPYCAHDLDESPCDCWCGYCSEPVAESMCKCQFCIECHGHTVEDCDCDH